VIYITDTTSGGEPCILVYVGKKMRWYYCRTEEELFISLIHLLNANKKFDIFNVYGKRIYIPNNPEEFRVKDELEEFEGILYNLPDIRSLIEISRELTWNKKKVNVKLRNKVNAEEILKMGIRIIKPVKLPRYFKDSPEKGT